MKREFLLYAAVSGVAWLVDFTILYAATLLLGMPDYLSAAVGYTVGLVVHYFLSVRYVFTYRRLATRSHAEMIFYAFSGGVGVALSASIVYAGGRFGLSLIISKIIATLVTFVVVFAIRKIALFSPGGNKQRRAP